MKLTSGKNVCPKDVEAHYEHLPFVSEVCVLGVKDEASSFARAEKLVAVVVLNFEYLKEQHIANTREWVCWELDGCGRELPEYQCVRDYILRTEPLPRSTTRKLKRFEMQRWLDCSGTTNPNVARDLQRSVLNEAGRTLLASPAGQIVTTALRPQKPPIEFIHSHMNLELDLGLDSRARVAGEAPLISDFACAGNRCQTNAERLSQLACDGRSLLPFCFDNRNSAWRRRLACEVN